MENGMNKKKQKTTAAKDLRIDENTLFEHVSAIIENRKSRAASYANSEATQMFWEVGRYVNSVMLDSKRAAYGQQIVATLSQQLQEKYGKTFELTNLRRMQRFAEEFTDYNIVATLSPQLSWSHIVELLPLKTTDAKLFYAKDTVNRRLGVRELRKQISRKAYERQEIANAHLSTDSSVPFNVFKDPYLLDVFGLKENFLEADLEKAILTELEKFILEFGHGFTFVERQKRITMDDNDYTLDLLFFHRILKRLVAVELKLGKFIPQHKGQMEFYLKWLNKYERQEGENEPIGLILCTKASRNHIELLELDKSGIAVAEYWTNLPPKAKLEQKIKEILHEAQERLERRKSLHGGKTQKQIDFFYEAKDSDSDE
jgi:predicted nuclease of restriction endonuclease-like (RecB) superfamily